MHYHAENVFLVEITTFGYVIDSITSQEMIVWLYLRKCLYTGYITQNKVFMNLISLSMQEKQLVLVNVTAGL